MIDSNPYDDKGGNWYTNQNNFFRQVRNFVIDLTAMNASSGAGIHWQVAQVWLLAKMEPHILINRRLRVCRTSVSK